MVRVESTRYLPLLRVLSQHGVEFIIVGRRAAPGAADYSAITMPEVSSTEVRQLLRAEKSAEGLVPRSVLDYIYRHGLYREPA